MALARTAFSVRAILARAASSLVIGLLIAAALPALAEASVTQATVDLTVRPGGSVTASWINTAQVNQRQAFSTAANGATTEFTFTAKGGTVVSLSESPASGFTFTGWSGSVSGTSVSSSFSAASSHSYSVTAGFGRASTYSVTFNESGLTGRQWSIDLNGSTTSSSGTTITFSKVSNGTYPYSINPPSGYAASPSSGSVVVNGRNQSVSISFQVLQYSVSFDQSGLSGQQWSVDLNGSTTSSSATTITFSKVSNGTYPYSINPPSGYAASPSSGSVVVNGGNQSVSVSFLLTDEQEAVASYQALQENLYKPSVLLYLGLPSYTCGPYSCLWPFTNAMAGTEYLYASPGGSSYAPDVQARLNGLLAYVNLSETNPRGASQPRAFQSAVAPPEGPGGNTFYDDNAWSALDLLDAYQLTGNPTDLALAQDTFNFVVTGWDTSQTDGCPGGVFWEDVSGSPRTTTANGGNAEVGLELYQLTHDSADLSWAEQMYQWANTCLESPGGLYYDHVNPGGSLNTTMWSYNQGTMVGAGALLYQITRNSSYLTAAQRTAGAAVSYFGTGTTLQNQGPAFNAIYFRDLFVLDQIRPDSAYTTEAQTYATFMWTQRDTSTGLFLQNGKTYGVNTTAPMVEIYSLLAGSTARP